MKGNPFIPTILEFCGKMETIWILHQRFLLSVARTLVSGWIPFRIRTVGSGSLLTHLATFPASCWMKSLSFDSFSLEQYQLIWSRVFLISMTWLMSLALAAALQYEKLLTALIWPDDDGIGATALKFDGLKLEMQCHSKLLLASCRCRWYSELIEHRHWNLWHFLVGKHFCHRPLEHLGQLKTELESVWLVENLAEMC